MGVPGFERNAALFHQREALRAGDIFRVLDAFGALPAEAKIPSTAVVVGEAAFSLSVVNGRHERKVFGRRPPRTSAQGKAITLRSL